MAHMCPSVKIFLTEVSDSVGGGYWLHLLQNIVTNPEDEFFCFLLFHYSSEVITWLILKYVFNTLKFSETQ